MPPNQGGSVEGLAVEFDDVAVGIEDVNLGMAGDGVGAELEAVEVVGGEVFAEALGVQPVEYFTIARDTEGEVNVLGVVGAAGALHGAFADDDVEMLVVVTDAEPEAGEFERRTVDLLHLENVAIEGAGAFEVVDANQEVVEARFNGHSDYVPGVSSRLAWHLTVLITTANLNPLKVTSYKAGTSIIEDSGAVSSG